MSPKLQRHVSKIFHRRISSSEKEEKVSLAHESPPRSPRSRPTFSLSSLSFRRQNANTPSILTPPHTPPLITTTFSSSPSSEEEEEGGAGENILHIRNPPPSLHEPENSSSLVNPTSYFDFSPSHFSHLHQELTLDRFHAHTAPPSPLATPNGAVPSSSRRRSNLLEPPITANRFEYFSSSSSSISQMNNEDGDGGENEPKSAFSDWGTSVGGGTESRNTSSEDLSESDEEGEKLVPDESMKDAREGEAEEEKEGIGEKARKLFDGKEEEDLEASNPFNPEAPPTSDTTDSTRRNSTPSVAAPPSALETSPPPPPPSSNSHSHTHSHHHRHHHHHHHHSSKMMAPKESRVAESSYPELAIAFLMSLKKIKGRKLDRRASTGSLGGAV
ncbi:hypothetical protein JCM3765_005083 [Sporobolomyces pararoseus]